MSFSTSLSGINAAKIAMSTIENNIANANTNGYDREIAQLEELSPSSSVGVGSQYGTGVIVAAVQQVNNQYLDTQVNDETAKSNYYQTLNQTLSGVQNVFGEASGNGGSLSNTISDFFNAFQESSNFPQQASYRQALLGKAQTLVSQLNSINQEITNVNSETDNAITSTVQQVNRLSQQIAQINQKISGDSSSDTNTLNDQRRALVDQLSKLVDINVTNNSSNPNLIDIESGNTSLVTGVQSNSLNANYNQTSGKWEISGSTSLIFNPSGGQLAGYLDARDQYLSNYSSQINQFAKTLITNVNAIASTGYGLNNATGNNFFTGSSAGTIGINSIMTSNIDNIPLSSQMNQPGNGKIAMQISDVQNQTIFNGGTQTPLQYYNQLVENMGNQINMINQNQNNHQQLLANITKQQQNIEGVNIDQEMTNLMSFQELYTANAKAMQTENSNFQALLQILQ